MPVTVTFPKTAKNKFYLALDLFLKLRDKTKIENSCGTSTNESWLGFGQGEVEPLNNLI